MVESHGGEAVVDFHGNRLQICGVMTPDVATGDWVLVHAGYSITRVSERDALATWDYLAQSGIAAIEEQDP